jgi:hypothetical protein
MVSGVRRSLRLSVRESGASMRSFMLFHAHPLTSGTSDIDPFFEKIAWS